MSDRWLHGILRGGAMDRSAGPLVVKVGGSLLARPRWAELIAELLAGTPRRCTVVVGGGPVVDGLRAIDAAAPQAAEAMHWRAIEALGITARIVAEALSLPLVDAPQATRGVLDVPVWLRRDVTLPAGWHVTSDSIAAVVAAAAAAGLLLAKSVPPPVGGVPAVAAGGWVDAHFPVVAARLDHIAWAAPISPMPAGPLRDER
jgi:aspartokinase-like uncharacterized kinase